MKIICLEGCSGAGKTTQYNCLNKYFSDTSYKHLAVIEKNYEPFKTAVEKWYNEKGPLIPFTEQDVKNFAKARAETFKNNFQPLEENLDLIIFDRYFYTSAVYQRSCGLSPEKILKINIEYGSPIPDITFFFDCNPEISFIRSEKRNKLTGKDHLFSINPQKIAEIKKVYINLISRRDEVIIINTEKSIEGITKELISKMEFIL